MTLREIPVFVDVIGVPDTSLQDTAPQLLDELERAGDTCRRNVATAVAVVAVEITRVEDDAVESALRPVRSDEVVTARAEAREDVAAVVTRMEEAYKDVATEAGDRAADRRAANRLKNQLHAVRAVHEALGSDPLEAAAGAAYHAIEAVGQSVIMGAAMDALQTCQMSGTRAQKARAYERGVRRAKAAMIPHLGLVGIAIALVWLLGQWVSLPLWLKVVVVGSSLFAVGADIVNWIHCATNLRRLDVSESDLSP